MGFILRELYFVLVPWKINTIRYFLSNLVTWSFNFLRIMIRFVRFNGCKLEWKFTVHSQNMNIHRIFILNTALVPARNPKIYTVYELASTPKTNAQQLQQQKSPSSFRKRKTSFQSRKTASRAFPPSRSLWSSLVTDSIGAIIYIVARKQGPRDRAKGRRDADFRHNADAASAAAREL